jgi:RNA recognition motif-containing protein
MAAEDMTTTSTDADPQDNGEDDLLRKIHVSRIPTSFNEESVKRILEEAVGRETVKEVALIYKRPDDGDNEEETGKKKEKEKKDKTKNKEDVASETEHRGFGFVTFITDDSYQRALDLESVRGGRKATSSRKHTLYLRPYAVKSEASEEMCYLWSQHRCPYGDKCKFVHEGQGGCLPVASTSDKKKPKCFAFKKGRCKKGDECPFSHDFVPSKLHVPSQQQHSQLKDSADQDVAETKETANKSARPESEKDCINWKTKGKCRKGGKCPYKHDEALLEAALQKKKRKQEPDGPNDKNNKKSKRSTSKQPLWIRLFGLNYETREHDVRQFLEGCGTIVEIQFPRFEDSGRSKGYCGVLFQSPKAVAKAVELDGQELMGRWLRIQAGKMLLDQWEDRENQNQEQSPETGE